MKRRTLLLTLVAFLSLGAMVFGLVTSGAWFSDTATSSGAILITGSLDLHVTGGPLMATNLEPGEDYSQLGIFCTKNMGTTTLKYRGLFESPVPISHDLLKYMTMKVERQTTGDWVTLQEILGNPPVESEGLPYYFKFPGQGSEVVNRYIVEETLAQNEEVCYRLSVKLDDNTPDDHQGESVKFVLMLEATQENNPGWQ